MAGALSAVHRPQPIGATRWTLIWSAGTCTECWRHRYDGERPVLTDFRVRWYWPADAIAQIDDHGIAFDEVHVALDLRRQRRGDAELSAA